MSNLKTNHSEHMFGEVTLLLEIDLYCIVHSHLNLRIKKKITVTIYFIISGIVFYQHHPKFVVDAAFQFVFHFVFDTDLPTLDTFY